MAHNKDTGIISKPVNTDDVCAILGVGRHDVGYLCSNEHKQINSASVCKPIRYDTPQSLTDEQRMGSSSDITSGIYYGIKIGLAQGRLSGLHSCNYEYQEVRPGTDWCRLDDFVGYNHKAKFNPNGVIYEPGFIDNTSGLWVRIEYDNLHNEANGIDIAKLVEKKFASIEGVKNLGNWYPYAMITVGTTEWISPLFIKDSSSYSPLYKNGWQQNWTVPVNTLANKTTIKSGDVLRVTIFFLQSLLEQFKGWDSLKDQTFNSVTPFNCPNAVNIPVRMQKLTALVANGTPAIALDNKPSCSFTWLEDRVVGREYTFYCAWRKVGSPQIDASGTWKRTAPSDISGVNNGFVGSNPTIYNLEGISKGDYIADWHVSYGDTIHNSGHVVITYS